jgi:hypothetical protein
VHEAWRLSFAQLAMDWSYRRVMVLGSKGRDQVITENIPYGSYKGNKKLDVYLPPAQSQQRRASHPASSSDDDNQENGGDETETPVELAPVIVLILTGGWGVYADKRYFVQVALTLRKKGLMVVVPDIVSPASHEMLARACRLTGACI